MKKTLAVVLVLSLLLTLSTVVSAKPATVTTPDERSAATINDYTELAKKDFDQKVMVKIPSNAHKFDAAGLTFEWVPKQKDDGYLVVPAEIFEIYSSFKIFVKCSNTYMYKTITEPGTYLIEQFEANNKIHNINMVWIGDFELKAIIGNSYFLKVISNYTAYEYGDGFVGATEFETADISDAVKFIMLNKGYAVEAFTGEYAQDVWSSIWEKDPILQALLPQYVWDSYTVNNPVDGDIVKFTTPFTVKGNEITEVSVFGVAADNAYIVFVNGKFVGCSDFLAAKCAGLTTENPDLVRQIFGTLRVEDVPDDSWRQVGNYDVSAFTNVGANVVTVYAANEYFDQDDYVENGDLHHVPGSIWNNPASMVFGFTVNSRD